MRNYVISLITLGTTLFLTTSFIKNHEANSSALVAEPQPKELITDGLYYAEFYDYIYRGHFENIEFTREDSQFLMIFEQYLRTFGKQCPSYLPEGKVEIMEQVCATEEVSRNIYGDEIGRTCIEWKWVGTGLFARPDLHEAKMTVEGMHRGKGFQTVMNMITDPNAVGNSVDMLHKSKGLRNDMSKFFDLNQCNSSSVQRFEDNLKFFALNQPSIRMEGTSKYAAMKKSGGPSGQQNFTKLIDDLVANQAQTWTFNKYIPGSIAGVSILSQDNEHRPLTLRANYSYTGFGSSNGWVKITFENGLPDCIYFFDFPDNCKTPNSSIIASYAQGNYGK